MTYAKASMADLVRFLESQVNAANGESPFAPQAHVVDKTGLTGEFDYTLRFAIPERSQSGGLQSMTLRAGQGGLPVSGTDTEPAGRGPGLFVALEQQLGLKLKPTKISLDVVVIDRAERIPVEN